MLSPGLSTHSSNHTFSPSLRNEWRFRHLTPALSPFEAEREEAHTTALSFELWLKKTSN
jgi:hypothetical protein